MLRPFGLKDNLMPKVDRAKDGQELFKLFLHDPMHAVLDLFLCCADDRTWIEQKGGKSYIECVIPWFAKEFHAGAIDWGVAQQVATNLRKNYAFLHPYLPEEMVFQLAQGEAKGSFLMWRYFGGRYINDLMDVYDLSIVLNHVPNNIFLHIKEFINTEQIKDLWKENPKTILGVIKIANQLELKKVSDFAFASYKNYLSKETMMERLLFALEEHFFILVQEMMQIVNQESWGFRLSASDVGDYHLHIESFSEDTFKIVEPLIPWITSFECHDFRGNKELLETIYPMFKRLDKVYFSGTSTRLAFEKLPRSVVYLDLSNTLWFEDRDLEVIQETLPYLHHLNLSGCSNLSYRGLSLITEFKELEHLGVNHQWGFREEEMEFLGQAIQLESLDLSYCENLNDRAIRLLVEKMANLKTLDLSYCSKLTREAVLFLKRLPSLQVLKLAGLSFVDDKLIREMKRSSYSLRKIQS